MKTCFILLFFLVSISSFSQPFVWGDHIGYWDNEYPIDLDQTSDGFILTTSSNAFTKGLYKYNKEGQKTWEFSFFEDYYHIFSNYSLLNSAVDENDNIYTILSTDVNSTKVTINGIVIYPGISLLKINSKGEVLWSKFIGGNGLGVKIIYKNQGLYIMGTFSGRISFDDNNTYVKSQEYYNCYSYIYERGEDYFIEKLNTDGKTINSITFGEDYPDFLTSATIDNYNNIYICGVSDFHTCTKSYTHITKVNSSFQIDWKKELSKEINGSGLVYPTNIFYSSDDRLYLWAYNSYAVITEDYSIPGDSKGVNRLGNIMKFNPTDGNFIKHKQFNTNTNNTTWGFAGMNGTLNINNGFLMDYGKDTLIVYSSFRGPLTLDNRAIEPTYQITKYKEFLYNENLLLFKVDKQTFKSDFITNFTGALPGGGAESFDNPGPAIIDDSGCMYFTAAFKENPLCIFKNPIYNNSGNNSTDILFAKIDLNKIKNEPKGAGIPQSEYQTLMDIYNSTGGENWKNTKNWMDTITYSVNDWYGISVKEGHVYRFTMPENYLTQFPDQLKNLPYLEQIILSYSGFQGEIPDLTSLSKLQSLTLEYNKYSFGNLSPLLKWSNYEKFKFDFDCDPQFPLGIEQEIFVNKGDSIEIKMANFSPDNTDKYYWAKDGQYNFEENNPTLKIKNALYSDEDTYYCNISNSQFPGLYLRSAPIKLHVNIPVNASLIKESKFNIHPNPAHHLINVSYNELGEFTIQVYNILGIKVLEKRIIQSEWIDINMLNKGVYIFKLISNGEVVENQKIQIN